MWVNIKAAYSRPEDVLSFNHGQMISYFVSRTAADGLLSSDIKSINKAAKHLYDCGRIQNVEVALTVMHYTSRQPVFQKCEKTIFIN